jgi:RNA polymerase sigma factor (sigma-70 family)
MLPLIRRIARYNFRRLPLYERDDAIQEVVAGAYVAFARLVQRGKADIVYATPLALFAVRQYLDGRRVGSRLNIRDVASPYCQQRKDISLESLTQRNESGDWEQLAVEDRHATPADVAATRLDFRAWLRRLDRTKRTAAKLLAGGATTMDAAKQLKVSQGRVSQLRRELKEAWEEFQGESRTLVAA